MVARALHYLEPSQEDGLLPKSLEECDEQLLSVELLAVDYLKRVLVTEGLSKLEVHL